MAQLRQQQDRLNELNIDVKLVAFDDDIMARAYADSTELQWPLLLDQERKTYHDYGMGRASWWAIYKPDSIFKYIWLIVRGKRPGKPGADWRQMGGDVLIDPDGTVRLHHLSKDPHDRPTVYDIFRIVDS